MRIGGVMMMVVIVVMIIMMMVVMVIMAVICHDQTAHTGAERITMGAISHV